MDEIKKELEGKSVLIVEDDPEYAETLADQLSSVGMEVIGMEKDGAGAITAVEKRRPNLVVMDIDFRGNGPDGIETARVINEKHPVAILVLSGHVSGDHIKRAKIAGVTTYLAKPQPLSALLPSLVLTIKNFNDIEALRKDLRDRKIIEQAKGLLMEKKDMGEKQAYLYMRNKSQNENKPMEEIARMILAFKDIM